MTMKAIRQTTWSRSKSMAPRTTRRAPLSLQSLEGRDVPSTYSVINNFDAGSGSLRGAVAQANAHPGADTITFAPNIGGSINLTTGEIAITDALTIDNSGHAARQRISNDSGNVERALNTSGAPSKTAINLIGMQLDNFFALDQGGALF